MELAAIGQSCFVTIRISSSLFYKSLYFSGLGLGWWTNSTKMLNGSFPPTFIFFVFSRKTLERFPKDETIWVSTYHLPILAHSPQNTILAKIFWTFHYFEKCSFFSLQNNFSVSKQYIPFAQGVHHRGWVFILYLHNTLPTQWAPHTTPTSHPK